MSVTEVPTVVLTDMDIAVLNQARTILERSAKECPNDWQGGKAHEAFEAAEHSVFHSLNIANSYGVRPMTEDQLHNRSEA